MPKLKYQRERRGSIIERQLEDDVVTLYQPIEELGVGKYGSVRAFASATNSVKFAVKRPLHPNKDTIHKLKVEKTFFEKAYPDTEVLFEEVDTLDCRLVMPLFPGKDFHNTQDLRIDNKIQLCTYKKLVFSVRFFHNLHEVLS
ncbi:hypothetical protein AVI51_08115 [Piscirickettsia salmonis]|nr:hypothetical protein [Piscirickettsia salmonis]ALA23970.1 lipopolysaccharide kinase family protein [Piscirickettsia salmonis]AMA41442.1 hypothetical protein AWJ11_02820 [Piscirickettsia salmonis]AOS33931.1 hypothetical protein AVM72_00075 [Piscirickettsia salmonis]APS44382.1 hypothetical protein AVI48_08405 [Piscirickettsia salmonis]APS47743.1 hypothetical protein AVI49_09015 [Piscirickettsia salmonis]